MQSASYLPQNRQQSTSNGARRYVAMPTSIPRSVQQSTSVYSEDPYGENSGDRYWDEPGGGGGHGASSGGQQADKPTGLRHFSTKVCEKVKEKGLTNYNEVADELVADYFQNNLMKQIDVVKQEYDMKNIRRRVYDALNVLLAMNIITKNKKDIRWIGLPASASQEIARLEEEKARREASIKAKMNALQEMIMQIVSYKNLVERNRQDEHEGGRPDQDSVLHLPFLIINTDKDANVDCSVSSDKSEFLFSFDKPYEIHDDFEVLKKMKMTCGLDTGTSTDEEIKLAKSYLPTLHEHYVDEIVSHHKKVREDRELEKKKVQLLASQQHQHLSQLQYYTPSPHPPASAISSRYNRQLQEHLMNDDSEDRSAAAGIMEKDDEMEKMNRPIYSYSPQKMRPVVASTSAPPPLSSGLTTRRYYVQKTPQGTIKREISPAVRSVTRPYATASPGDRRIAAGGGTVGAPIKYYVPQGQSTMQQAQGPRYRVRPPPPLNQPQLHHPTQRVVYSTAGSSQLPPGAQRVISQRVVGPGGPHPPGTIVRKVIRKVVVNSNAPKQSPAQQVIQKKMLEQDMIHERKLDQPMTSAQAAALIQHPNEEFDYFE